VKEESQE